MEIQNCGRKRQNAKKNIEGKIESELKKRKRDRTTNNIAFSIVILTHLYYFYSYYEISLNPICKVMNTNTHLKMKKTKCQKISE